MTPGNKPPASAVDGDAVALLLKLSDGLPKRGGRLVVVELLLGHASESHRRSARLRSEVAGVLTRALQSERYRDHAKQHDDQRDHGQRDPAGHQGSPSRNPRP